MKKFNELKIGQKYLISFTEEKYPDFPKECYFEGIGVLTDKNPPLYKNLTLKFYLPEEQEYGFFDLDDIVIELIGDDNE